MTSYRIVALEQRIADEVRRARRSPGYGHPAHVEVAGGTGPCRLCLRPFAVGEETRVLFTHNPFPEGMTPSPGPVFIHAVECPRYEADGFPTTLDSVPLLLEGYDGDGMAVVRRAANGDRVREVQDLLADTRVLFVHVRHAKAGCFIARVERPCRHHVSRGTVLTPTRSNGRE
jgi:hypothetical protein